MNIKQVLHSAFFAMVAALAGAGDGDIVMNGDDLNNSSYTTASFAPDSTESWNRGKGVQWSDGRFPHKGGNYFTNGKFIRNTKSSTFGGDSLTQDGGFRIGDNPVICNNWIFRDGAYFQLTQTAGTEVKIGGEKLTVETSQTALEFRGNANLTILLSGSLVGESSARMKQTVASTLRLTGDNTAYKGTVECVSGGVLEFASNLPNGTVDLAEGAELEIAEGETIALGKLKTAADYALSIPASSVLRVSSFDLGGALTVCEGGVLELVGDEVEIDRLIGENGTVALAADARVNVGKLISRGVTIRTAGGLLALGEPIDRTGGDVLLDCQFSDSSSHDIVSLPVGKGVLTPGDFKARIQFALSVRTEGGMQILSAANLLPSPMDATTGYVVMTNSDGQSSATYTTASFAANTTVSGNRDKGVMWSDGLFPHPGTNYFTNGKQMRVAKDCDFGGDRLVMNSSIRLGGGQSIGCSEWLLMSGASMTVNPVGEPVSLSGRITILSDAARPLTFPSASAYHIAAEVLGDALSVCEVSAGTLRFAGNANGYAGSVRVGTNGRFELKQTSMAEGTVALTAGSSVFAVAEENRVFCVKRVSAADGGEVVVPTGASLKMDELDAAGVLSVTGAGRILIGGNGTSEVGSCLALGSDIVFAPLSSTALGRASLSLADGAGFAYMLAPQDEGLRTDGLIVSGDITLAEAQQKVPVVIEQGDATVKNENVVLFTISTEKADEFRSALSVTYRGKAVEMSVVPAAAGLSRIVAKVRSPGLILLFR